MGARTASCAASRVPLLLRRIHVRVRVQVLDVIERLHVVPVFTSCSVVLQPLGQYDPRWNSNKFGGPPSRKGRKPRHCYCSQLHLMKGSSIRPEVHIAEEPRKDHSDKQSHPREVVPQGAPCQVSRPKQPWVRFYAPKPQPARNENEVCRTTCPPGSACAPGKQAQPRQ